MNERVQDMQSDWFIREVRRCMEIGMPLGCCGEWPECSHVLAWVESRMDADEAAVVSLSAPTETNAP